MSKGDFIHAAFQGNKKPIATYRGDGFWKNDN
jgi:hypothetical protein